MERLVFSTDSFYLKQSAELLFFLPANNISLTFFLPCEQGLLRQLVLLPGSDAIHHICPSLTPQLAALSVPPLLLDVSHPGTDDDHQVIYHSNLEIYFTRINSDMKSSPIV